MNFDVYIMFGETAKFHNTYRVGHGWINVLCQLLANVHQQPVKAIKFYDKRHTGVGVEMYYPVEIPHNGDLNVRLNYPAR